MQTEIWAELGEAIAPASSTPTIQFNLIWGLLLNSWDNNCASDLRSWAERAANRACGGPDFTQFQRVGSGELRPRRVYCFCAKVRCLSSCRRASHAASAWEI